jgi:hypothetical protein
MANGDKMPLYPPGEMFASPWFLKVDDNLRLTSYNALASVRLEVRYRFFDCDGKIQASQEAQAPNTDRTAKSSIFVTPEGWLLGGEVFVSGAAPLIGQTYVVLEIVRGLGASALPLQVIAAGYVSAKQPLPFPNAQMYSTLDGGGAMRSISGTTPGAGAEISETVPTGARWEVLAFYAQLVTNATVVNRQVQLRIDDGANLFFVSPAGQNITATQTGLLSWVQGQGNQVIGNRADLVGPLPSYNRLPAGARMRTNTANIQAADQYGAVQYLVREWLEGA